MIAARQIAFGKAAGAKKPYDAEVEYLEGDGEAYLNTELNSTTDKFCDFEIKYCRTKNSGNGPFGLTYGASARYGIFSKNGGDVTKLYVGANNTNTVEIPRDVDVWHTVRLENGVAVTLDGVSTPVGEGTVRSNVGLYLFAVGSSSDGLSKLPQEVKISYCKIWNTSGVLLRDFIPVRVGDIGYMYDKVNGKLFGNSGTGDFVLGDDI